MRIRRVGFVALWIAACSAEPTGTNDRGASDMPAGGEPGSSDSNGSTGGAPSSGGSPSTGGSTATGGFVGASGGRASGGTDSGTGGWLPITGGTGGTSSGGTGGQIEPGDVKVGVSESCFSGRCYIGYGQPGDEGSKRNFDAARAVCQDWGGDLAIIDSAAEAAEVGAFAAGYWRAFVGIESRGTVRPATDWPEWVDGTEHTAEVKALWPDPTNGGMCGSIEGDHSAGSSQGKLFRKGCDELGVFICEKAE